MTDRASRARARPPFPASAAAGDAVSEGARTERQALTQRQEMVLRAVVASHVAEAAPVGSRTLSLGLPVRLSAASIRNTMAELTRLGLIEQPHPSAGRVPTARGLRVFVDGLVPQIGRTEAHWLAGRVDHADPGELIRLTSKLLSEHTRQLGFVAAPRIEQLVLRHVTLVRLSTSRVLGILVTENGVALRRLIEDHQSGDQAELDRMAASLNERLAGRTLAELRSVLEREVRALRSRAQGLIERAVILGWRALQGTDDEEAGDLVIATRLALLDQPEFQDPGRVRQLFAALETKESLVHILVKILDSGELGVAIGEEMGEPDLRELALVAAPYGAPGAPLGVLGVIGPSRMDYARVMGMVNYLSRLITEKLAA